MVGQSTRQEKKDPTGEIQLNMTQEERNTMLVALASYMPYKVMVEYDYGDGVKRATEFNGNYYYLMSTGKLQWKDFKPYLRSLSSMTKDEFRELNRIYTEAKSKPYLPSDSNEIDYEYMGKIIEYCNKHKFDYRGLIEKGLAIEAPKDLYRK